METATQVLHNYVRQAVQAVTSYSSIPGLFHHRGNSVPHTIVLGELQWVVE